MDKEIVKDILLRTGGSFTDQIDHEPYNKFGEALLNQIIDECKELQKTQCTAMGVANTIKRNYLK